MTLREERDGKQLDQLEQQERRADGGTKQWLEKRLAQLTTGNRREFEKNRFHVVEEEDVAAALKLAQEDPYRAFMRAQETVGLIEQSFYRFYGAPVQCHLWDWPDEKTWLKPFMVAYDADAAEVRVPTDVMRWDVSVLDAALERLTRQYAIETAVSAPLLQGTWLLLIQPHEMMGAPRSDSSDNYDLPAAFVGATVAGFAVFNAEDRGPQDTLTHLWVAASMRKQGHAKRLVERAQQYGLKAIADRYMDKYGPVVNALKKHIK